MANGEYGGHQIGASPNDVISQTMMPGAMARVGMVLFNGFELLDVAGPLEVLGQLPLHFVTTLLGPTPGPVSSAQGVSLVADLGYTAQSGFDILMVPGGQGTRTLVDDRDFVDWLAGIGERSTIVSSVCTGAALLARARLLDGYTATSNKRAFAWVSQQSSAVTWVESARWVVDSNRWTSSGVSAGIDMTLALVAHLLDRAAARDVARQIEHTWMEDPRFDPFSQAPDDSAGEIVTVFRSRHKEDPAGYAKLANQLESLAHRQDGFRDFKTFASDDGERCSIAVFADVHAQRHWAAHPLHRQAQRRASADFYTEFSVMVAQVLSTMTMSPDGLSPDGLSLGRSESEC
jgi:transcriptional regulator GlxA family with amidase domain